MGSAKRRPGRPKAVSDVPIGGGRALEPDGTVPLYFQLAVALSVKLESQAWEPGSRFATEREIEEEFGVSRSVVRRALDLLVGDGEIERIRGLGAFVSAERHQIAIAGVIGTLLEPRKVTLRVEAAREERADETLIRRMDLPSASKSVAHITALMEADGEIVGLIDSFSVLDLVPGVLAAVEVLDEDPRAAELGRIELTRVKAPIELTHFGDWGGARVGASAGDPAFRGTLLQFGRRPGRKREHLVELAYVVYRGDNVQLDIEIEHQLSRSPNASSTKSR
jgi:DNA-binding GntR family transcriptional regulator